MSRPQAPVVDIRRWDGGVWAVADDSLAAEEPLQILLDGEPLTVVMRTPGNDVELALGLLHAERVISSPGDVASVAISAEAGESEGALPLEPSLLESNHVDVRLRRAAARVPRREFTRSSACGVCGATTIEELALDFPRPGAGPRVDAELLASLPDRLRKGQELFERTGGLHAAGVFDAGGSLAVLREDAGRHNAVDKAAGRLLLDGALPASDTLLAVSGRAGFEIVQKAVAAGVPVVAAVGAPSSLAVATAREFGVTLAGFVRNGRFNVYAGPERVLGGA
ncbi:MAG: formate dehydrogenase accessory sulfurtransferase FdhD [Candidatus Dormibacteraeota bacterium]|nr:formate dehydrogenase accessory sulfurtransferase FdhD [Candidatus Dormibacteraeota bacterium]MBO0761889.1 formate dehydrogenase accessory sulfurtransferase FdhD [Candidatus Dormibacteraeota bacterium]